GGKILIFLAPKVLPAVNLYPLRYTWLAVIYAVVLLLGVVEGIAGRGLVAALLPNRGFALVGGSAACPYMLHQRVFGLAFRAFHQEPWFQTASDLALVFVSLAVSLALSAASWQWFEKRILVLGHRVPYTGQPAEAIRQAA